MIDVTQKVLRLSEARPPTAEQQKEFSPSASHEAIAAVLGGPRPMATLKDLADAAGLDVRTVQRTLAEPAALSWMASKTSELPALQLGAVHARLLAQALNSNNSSWLKLYLERFDGEYKKQKVAEKGGIRQVNNAFLGDMSENELVKWISREWRGLQGAVTPIALGPPGGVPGVDGGLDREAGGMANLDESGRDPALQLPD